MNRKTKKQKTRKYIIRMLALGNETEEIASVIYHFKLSAHYKTPTRRGHVITMDESVKRRDHFTTYSRKQFHYREIIYYYIMNGCFLSHPVIYARVTARKQNQHL